MLALKSILARVDHIPTLILDEVDAGIGGQTAKIVGEKLRRIARSHQVFCITHLPQIASYGDQHHRVEKVNQAGQTEIRVQVLSFAKRIEEIARLSGGTRYYGHCPPTCGRNVDPTRRTAFERPFPLISFRSQPPRFKATLSFYTLVSSFRSNLHKQRELGWPPAAKPSNAMAAASG
ncbi:hypothetical protein NKDENANG_02333 [Candidatus Entotheonellaceae bacterium PAL068K]